MLCDVCRGRGSETKAKEDFRQFPRASESRTAQCYQTLNVLIYATFNKMILLQVAH